MKPVDTSGNRASGEREGRGRHLQHALMRGLAPFVSVRSNAVRNMGGAEHSAIFDFRISSGTMEEGTCPRGTVFFSSTKTLPMTTLHTDSSSKDGLPATSLAKVLGRSEHAEEMVAACAQDLHVVNSVLREGLAEVGSLPHVDVALETNASVTERTEAAAAELSAVNLALIVEVKEQLRVENQLADARANANAAHQAAMHDALTGLPNRVLFLDRLEHELAVARRHGWKLAVMFIDLDDFKDINDSYGHAAGDLVLKVVAERLQATTRAGDTVSRHGGDEFLYLLTEVRDERDVIGVATKIIAAVQQPCDVAIAGLSISPRVNASVGISIFPDQEVSADALISAADRAMYCAKRHRSGYAMHGRK
ncbi:MAG: GGDEF domain-containing protein [Pseudomonadota bacterium]